MPDCAAALLPQPCIMLPLPAAPHAGPPKPFGGNVRNPLTVHKQQPTLHPTPRDSPSRQAEESSAAPAALQRRSGSGPIMSGGWRRLPAFLPNISLKLLPLSEAEQAAYQQTGRVRELVFKTAPSVSKVRACRGRRRRRPPLHCPCCPAARSCAVAAAGPGCPHACSLARALLEALPLLVSVLLVPTCLAALPALLHTHTSSCCTPLHPAALLQLEIKAFLESVYGLSVAKVGAALR